MPPPIEHTPESNVSRPPEIDQKINDLFSRLIDADTVKITADTRGVISDILGQEKAKELVAKGRVPAAKITMRRNPDVTMRHSGMHKILEELTKSGKGMFPHIQKRVEQKMKEEAIKSIDKFPLRVGAGAIDLEPLDKLVRDADSQGAWAIAWLYSSIVTPANFHQYKDIFDPVDENEVMNADALLKLQKLYNEVKSDKEYKGIGLDPDEDSSSIGSGTLKTLRKKVDEFQKQASDTSKIKGGNPDPFLNRADKAEEKIDALTNKRKELSAKLTQINSIAMSLKAVNVTGNHLVIAPISDVDVLSQNFSEAELRLKLPDITSAYMEVGGTMQTVDLWLEDEELQSKAQQAITQFRSAGKGLVPSAMALDRLNRRVIGIPVGMSEQELESLYQETSSRMLSGGSAEEQPKKPGFLKRVFGVAGSAAGAGASASEKAAQKGKGLFKYLFEDV